MQKHGKLNDSLHALFFLPLPTFSAGICGQKYYQPQWPAPRQKNGFIVAPETGTKSRNADKLPGDFPGRCWYGLLGNFDEAYDFLLSLGLLSDPSTSSKDKAKSKVNPYQSAFKLLQFGSSARAAKTAGSYGERPDRTISMVITCKHAPGAVHPNGKGRNWKPCCFHQGKVPRCHWPTGTTS